MALVTILDENRTIKGSKAIAAYLATSRAVRCQPEQVIVVSGSQQGLDLAGRVLLDPGDAVGEPEPAVAD